MKYIFIGTESQITGRIKLMTFGQSIELDPKEAEEWQLGRVAILPEDEFAELNITPEEMKRYPHVGAQINAPAEFKAKLQEARKRFSERFVALRKAQEPVVPISTLPDGSLDKPAESENAGWTSLGTFIGSDAPERKTST